MSWKEEFHERIVKFLVKNGSPVEQVRRSAYGWLAGDWEKLYHHLGVNGCSVDASKCTWKDSDWSEFAGTFAEPPWEDKQGIDVTVYCKCGKIHGRVWRYSGTHGDLLRGITDDE